MGAAKISMTQQVVALLLVKSEMSPARMPPGTQTNSPTAASGTTAASHPHGTPSVASSLLSTGLGPGIQNQHSMSH